MQNPSSGVQIAFVYGGISNGERAPGLLSLGVIYNTPFWIFYSSDDPLDRLSQVKGKRIAVGPIGSGVRLIADRVFGTDGITAATATFLPYTGAAAVDALKDGKVDAVWISSTPDAPIIKTMLRMPNVRLMSVARAEALTRIFPDLVRLALPQGVFDIAGDIPPNDVSLIGTTVHVLIRDDLHPAIVRLLLQTMIKEHVGPGIFNEPASSPRQTDPEFPIAPAALDFYKNGPSLLNRYLPYWIVPHVLRLLAVLLAGGAIIYPLFNFAPKLYRWFLQDRMRKLYRRLRIVEEAAQTELIAPRVVALQTELEDIDRAARILPQRHSDLFFILEHHIALTRTQLASRLVEVRRQITKVV